MKDKLLYYWKRLPIFLHTIRARILLSTISIIMVFSACIIFVAYFLVSNIQERNLVQTSETRLSFLCSSIDSNVSDVQSFIRSCQINSQIRDFALSDSADDNLLKREARDFANEVYTSNSSLHDLIVRLVIISKSRDDIVQVVDSTNSHPGVSSDRILNLPYFEELHSHAGEITTGILSDPFFTTKDVPMIPFVHIIDHPYRAGEIGYIFTEMSTSVITEPIKDYLSENTSRLCFRIGEYDYVYEDGTLVSCPHNYELIKDMSTLALSSDTTICMVREKESQQVYLMVQRPLELDGWYVSEYLEHRALSREINRSFFLIVLLVLTLCTVIGAVMFGYLSATVNTPVKKLLARMQRISDGDFSRDPSTEWNHELGRIGTNINNLTEQVHSLMEQQLADERQKRDYEYKMLQSQINPHFLYNTLNSIKWMATIQNAPGIAEMTTALSRLLRDISKGTTTLVSVAHEIALIKDYFTIQQYRYGGTITLDFQIEDEALLSCKILKFTLQPLVENSIFHGIEPKGTAGNITIHIYQDDKTDVHIDVTDNGVGMNKEQADQLLYGEQTTSSSFFKEIGVSNVHKRLQYEFGEGYGLSVDSVIGEYTTVSILLPYQVIDAEGDEHHTNEL